jgi:hypothetical protein
MSRPDDHAAPVRSRLAQWGEPVKLLVLFFRGFTLVACTACNVKLISRGLYGWAFVTGWAISALWWTNCGKAADDRSITSLLIYATGAATGTVVGAWVGGWL